MEKIIITVVGKDTVGIIAAVCTYLAENSVNILDISQTITGGYFNMMMIADASPVSDKYAGFVEGLKKAGEAKGVVIRVQREEIFDSMHRI